MSKTCAHRAALAVPALVTGIPVVAQALPRDETGFTKSNRSSPEACYNRFVASVKELQNVGVN
jgi:hypothetical protein